MSDYGSAILARLNETSELSNPDNPVYKIIDRSLGEWLDAYEDNNFFEMSLIQYAVGKWLDLHGKEFNVLRKLNEDDETYRKRIIYETLNELTVNYLIDVFNLTLYIKLDNFNVFNNNLTSDNPYLSKDKGYMAVASETVKSILNKKFVLGSSLKWLIL